MFLSGILPMSSAVMTSSTVSEARLASSDCSSECADAGDDDLLERGRRRDGRDCASASAGGASIARPSADLTANADPIH